MITLADLKGFSEEKVFEHLVENYSRRHEWDEDCSDEFEMRKNEEYRRESSEKLAYMEILVAYESVGDWGCDSESFFLFKRKTDGLLFELHGSHCSCYGFEGQLDLEETSLAALKYRAENANVFYAGGYDKDETENQRIVNEYIKSL